MKKNRYFYLITEPPKNVVLSQVIEYAEALQKGGLEFKVIFLLPVRDFIKNREMLLKSRDIIAERLKAKPEFHVAFIRKSTIGVYIGALVLFQRLWPYGKGDHLIFHARGGYSTKILSVLKRFGKKISFIYDIRGDNIAEFDYFARKNNMPDDKREKAIVRSLYEEKRLLQGASHLFCVSNILKNEIASKYRINSEKITVIPCAADSKRFGFDLDVREEMRRKLNIQNKFVLIYPGGIGNWHSTDKVFKIAGDLIRKYLNVYIIILTSEVDKARKLAQELIPEGSYYIGSATRNEMPGYLMAADMGMLLRENHPLNKAAAPTKFAEYVISGLPVMISEYIGDYSKFIEDKGFGILIKDMTDQDEYISKFGKFLECRDEVDREIISRVGSENFSKSKYVEIMKQIYTTLNT